MYTCICFCQGLTLKRKVAKLEFVKDSHKGFRCLDLTAEAASVSASIFLYRFRGLNEIAEAASALSLRTLKRLPRYH
jgi:hypothetical protein